MNTTSTTLSLDWHGRADASRSMEGLSSMVAEQRQARNPPAPTISPIDGRVLAELVACGANDVDRAVAAARRAFPAWARSGGAEKRKGLLLALAA